MNLQVDGAFSVQSWDETTWEGENYSERKGRKQTHALVTFVYEGEIKGESAVHYLMSYNEDGTGTFVGLERFSGSVAGREGDFVLQHAGTFDAESVTAELSVAPGSGTAALSDITGGANSSIAGHQASYPISFSFALPD